jgi:ketosteroid isomerase-like protein
MSSYRYDKEEPMSDLQATTDRVEIEALRAEFTDAAMMRDYDRFASLFTHDAVYRIPDADIEQTGREQIRAGVERLADEWKYFVQTTHPGAIELDGDTASGRAYIQELGLLRDGRSVLNYALFHDRYRRTPDGWKFTERVYEVRYFDTTPAAGLTRGGLDGPDPRGIMITGPSSHAFWLWTASPGADEFRPWSSFSAKPSDSATTRFGRLSYTKLYYLCEDGDFGA